MIIILNQQQQQKRLKFFCLFFIIIPLFSLFVFVFVLKVLIKKGIKIIDLSESFLLIFCCLFLFIIHTR
jgi:hypothetical protein